jgi:hypothetical protein
MASSNLFPRLQLELYYIPHETQNKRLHCLVFSAKKEKKCRLVVLRMFYLYFLLKENEAVKSLLGQLYCSLHLVRLSLS